MKTAANYTLKAVIFDMDGVLLDSESLHYLAIDRVVSSRGGTYSVELLHKYCGVPEREIWPSLIKDTGLIGAEPAECMVIEDSPNGMIAARRAGMKWVGFEGAEVKPDMRYAVYKFSDYRTMTAEQLELWYRSFPQQERDE